MAEGAADQGWIKRTFLRLSCDWHQMTRTKTPTVATVWFCLSCAATIRSVGEPKACEVRTSEQVVKT